MVELQIGIACMNSYVFDQGISFILCEIVHFPKKSANKLHNLSLKMHFKVIGGIKRSQFHWNSMDLMLNSGKGNCYLLGTQQECSVK